MASNTDISQPDILKMSGISKAFPGVQALDQANLSVRQEEIHGLVGENGAGKSTIIKILAGVYGRDGGAVLIDGNELQDLSSQKIHDSGVRFIHQELHLVPHFNVAESVFMGQELSGAFGLDRAAMRQRAEEFLKDTLHADISGAALIRDLGIAERKLVQVARALIDNEARLVVFDEPTAPLASSETEQVFKAIRRMKERGITMVYVSHYLGEITELCDRVTVFRNGRDVAVVDEVGPDTGDVIIKHMVGRDLAAIYPEKNHNIATPALEIKSLGDGENFSGIDLAVGKGEILGIAGLIGSGREELIDTLYGLRQPELGSMALEDETVHISSPADAVERGVVLVPRDRRNDGLVLDMSVADNINLASLDEVAVVKMENPKVAAGRARALSDKLDIRPGDINAISRFLSGGNQQKTVLARWLATGSRLFLLDEPTVGVDIGAKVEIYRLIEDLARQGAGVIVSSSDSAELLGLCDRIVVLLRGELIADRQAESLTLDSLLALTTGGVDSGATI